MPVGQLASGALGNGAIAGQQLRSAPLVQVQTPDGVVTAPVLAFDYISLIGRPQVSYQYQVRSQDGTLVLFDSGTVISSSNTGITITFTLSAGTSYQIWARASDTFDTSEWSIAQFKLDLFDANDYPISDQVGSIYEIGINGQGLMLSDTPERMVTRRSAQLDAPRFATGDTPFSEAIERYTFIGQESFRGGAGQRYRDRPDSDETRFLDSRGVNPFLENGGIELLHQMDAEVTDTYATPLLTVASGRTFLVTANGELTSKLTPGGASTVFTITGAGAPTSVCSDGTNWYYADGANVFRNSSAADPVTAWSTLNAELVRWAADRIAVTYDDGSGNICVSTLGPTGTEEVAGGRFKYPSGSASVADIAAGDGYMWFIVNRQSSSQIHFWQLGSADTYAAVGLTLPASQRATALGFYLGNVFIRAIETLPGGASRVIIYRCVPAEGRLTPQRVLDWDATNDQSVGAFAGNDRFVFFTWRDMISAGTGGVGCIDLSTGGWAKWLEAGAGTVRSIEVWNGRVTFTIDAEGQYTESTDYVFEGSLTTSLSDNGSGLTKIYDEVTATFDPLPNGGEVTLFTTVNSGTSYDEYAPTSTSGASIASNLLGLEGRSVGVKVKLNSDGVASPLIRTLSVKLHPRSLADQLIVLPVNCSDEQKGLNGQFLPMTSPGGGMKLVRWLEGLMATRVKFQDVDWPVTQSAGIWEVVDLKVTSTGVFNPQRNRRVDSAVAELTLRRAQ